MMKNTKKRLVIPVAASLSVALMLAMSTSALAAGRDYAPQTSLPQAYGSYASGSCGSGKNPAEAFEQGSGKSFSIGDLKNMLGKFCVKGSFNVPKNSPSGQPSAPAAPWAAPSPSAAPASTAAPATAPDNLAATEAQMVQLVNSERIRAGVPALTVNGGLTHMARIKSQDMITGGYFSHQSPAYGSPFDMMKTFGISFRTAGENIAMNQSVQAAHSALMNSEDHRANILNAAFREVGVGIVSDGHGNLYITQEFIG